MVVIVFGLPGSGKSYFARRLAELINADYINSDVVRQELLNKKTYSEQEKLFVYNEMVNRMKARMKQNRNVIIDATFYKHDIRKLFTREAKIKNEVAFIEVVADEAVISERLKTPRAESDADFEVYKKIKEQWQPLQQPHLVLQSTNDNIGEMLHKASDYLNLNNDKRADK